MTEATFQQAEVAEWAKAMAAQATRARAIAEPLRATQLCERPHPKSWSVAHCFDHLATTLAAYRPFFERGLEAAEAKGTSGSGYRPGWFGRWFVRMAGEGARKLPAPKMFLPEEDASPGALERFIGELESFRALLSRADAVDLNATKFRSPASGLLKFRIGEGIDLMVAHNARHLGQAERARAVILDEPEPAEEESSS